MLLSDIDIAKRLVHPNPRKRLVVTPIISAEEQMGPSSLDVRLSTDFQRLENMNLSHIALGKQLPEKEETYTKRVIFGSEREFLSFIPESSS